MKLKRKLTDYQQTIVLKYLRMKNINIEMMKVTLQLCVLYPSEASDLIGHTSVFLALKVSFGCLMHTIKRL